MFIFILIGLFAVFYFVEHFFTPYGRRHSGYRNNYPDNRLYGRRDRYQDPYERGYYPRERHPYHDDHYYYRDRYEGRGGGGGAIMILLGIAGIAFLFFNMADANKLISTSTQQEQQHENHKLNSQSIDGSFIPKTETSKSGTDRVTSDNYQSKTISQNKNVAPSEKQRMKPQRVSSISLIVKNNR